MNLFEFYVDDDKFWDPRIDELALEEPELKLTANAAGELTFTIYPSHPKYNSFKPLTSTIEVYRDGQWYWEGRIVDQSGSFDNAVTYTVEGALGYLNDSIQPQEEYHELRPIGFVEKLLNVHNSQVPENRQIQLGAVTVVDPNDSLYCTTNFDTTLSCLKTDLIDDLGGYLRLRKKNGSLYLDAIAEPDRTCSQIIRIGENLIDLAPNFDYKDIASVIIPLGAKLEDQETHEEGLEVLDKYVTIEEVNDGKNYIARQDLLNKYDQIWAVVRFDNVHLPANLLRKAKEYLTDGQWGEMIIEATAFDLNYTSEEFQEFRLLDRVRVKSDLHGIDRYFPLTALTINFNNPENNTITLGGTGSPVTITGVTNQVTINADKLDERIKDPNRLIQQAIYQATQLITQGLNGFVRVNGNEILIMDTDDPATAKHVWRWNMGGLGYSNNGYEGPFETAITMDGTIVGKFLAANSVATEQIDVSYTSHVEELCNGYTDDKLGNYYTRKETETYFKTGADSIIAGVNSTLEGYVTNQSLSSQLSITESNIKTSVSNTLKSYSTTSQVESLIDQKADSITSTVTNTLKSYSTTTQVQSMIKQSADAITTQLSKYATDSELQTLEQKITADGIFTTINSGLAGSKNFKTTKFTIDKSGITVQGGGITVKNDSGTDVLYQNTDGDLSLVGDIRVRYTSGNTRISLTKNGLLFYKDTNGYGSSGGISMSGDNLSVVSSIVEISAGSNPHLNYLTATSNGLTLGPGNEGYNKPLELSHISSLKITQYNTQTTVETSYTGYSGTLMIGTSVNTARNYRFVHGILVGLAS